MRNITILGARGVGKTILRDYYLRMIEEGERIMGKETKWTLTMTDDGFEIGSTDGERTLAFGNNYVKISAKAFIELQDELVKLREHVEYLKKTEFNKTKELDRYRGLSVDLETKISTLEQDKAILAKVIDERNEEIREWKAISEKKDKIIMNCNERLVERCATPVNVVVRGENVRGLIYSPEAKEYVPVSYLDKLFDKIDSLVAENEELKFRIKEWHQDGMFIYRRKNNTLVDKKEYDVVSKALELAVEDLNHVYYRAIDRMVCPIVSDSYIKAAKEVLNKND